MTSAELPACENCENESESKVLHCRLCHPWPLCGYQVAKREAWAAPLAITNTAYFISEANGPGMFSSYPLVICDEADTLEQLLISFCETHISERRRLLLEIEFPEYKTIADSWDRWLHEEATPKITEALGKIPNPPETRKQIKEVTYLTRLLDKLAKLEDLLARGNVVYDGYARGEIVFQPIRVDQDANQLLWRHGQKFLLMSATLIPDELEQSLGIEKSGIKWGTVNVPSTFPKENRPIYVRSAANMIYKEKETEWPKMVDAVIRVLNKYPNDRTLIHTVSYDFTSYLFEGLRKKQVNRPVVVYGSAKERDEALRIFTQTPGGVLLAPSMERGVDLKDDLARVVIICKVPWLSTKDKRVEKRLYTSGGQLWYRIQAVRSIIQMAGRHIRSQEDWGVTFILDSQFTDNLWKKTRGFFPPWFKEALDFGGGGV